MKTSWPLITLALGTAMMAPARGGTLTYVAIPAQNSDTQAGLRGENIYTSAVDGGNAQDADRIVNGVALHPLKGSGNTAIADHVTISVASGALANANFNEPPRSADGLMGAALADALANEQADDNSEQYVVLDPSSLKAGQTYDLRVYVAPVGQQNRSVNLSFLGDGKEPISTDFFNEDDATTIPGHFTSANQAYFINYRYTWDGTTTPGFTVTQKSGKNAFLLFALTNQIAAVEKAAPPTEVANASTPAETAQAVLAFILERLVVQLRTDGARHDVLNAVFGAAGLGRDDDIVDLLARTDAVTMLLRTKDGADLLAAYRRAANILRIENRKDGPHEGAPTAGTEPAEAALYSALASLADVTRLLQQEDYSTAMATTARLRAPLDRFFDQVTVNATEPELRRNRLRLLNEVRSVMDQIADFSRIEG